ncbi:lactonase family protein [Wenyingzhuangia sp. IMCC45574]
MSLHYFFIGSYTEMLSPTLGGTGKGIYTVSLNNYTGELKVLHTQKITNPSYLVKHKDKLYSVVEVVKKDKPKIATFTIKKDNSLELIDEKFINGCLPCHINHDSNSLFIACYGSGNIIQYPIDTNGSPLDNETNYYHPGNSINPQRQESAHAHQVYIHPDKKHVLVPDLGIDTIKVYQLEHQTLLPQKDKDIKIHDGNGPRHLVFNASGSIGYLLNELSGEITIISKENNSFKLLRHVPSLPNSYKETPSASAIRLHPNLPYLYIANRVLEAITIFKTDGEEILFKDYYFLNGKTIREFNISPNGKWLIACMQDSNDTYVLRILQNGLLEEVYHTKEIVSPVCICF